MSASSPPSPCPYCGAAVGLLAVHGHGQCAACGVAIEPCCGGAAAASEMDQAPPAAAAIDPQLLPRLFDQLGGVSATVTEECLLNALARSLDASRDDARLIVEAAIALGQLHARAGQFRLQSPPRT